MLTLAIAASLFLSTRAPARAGLPEPAALGRAQGETLFIRGERVYVRPDLVLEDAAVLVERGVITAVGKDLTPPEGAREIRGKVVCAGFIDPWAVFGLNEETATDERTSAASRSSDGLDTYLDPRFRRELLRAGVTALRVQGGTSSRSAGIGSLVRVHTGPGGDRGVLLDDCCVAFGIGLTRGGRGVDLFDRFSELDRVVGALGDGLAYLQDKIEYRHDLEEWEKTIAEKEGELEAGFKKAKKDREKEEAEAKEKGKEFKEKSYKEDKRPKPPKYDEDKEVLARVVNGELPLVVEAHRASELRGLLEGTAKFDRLRLIVAGGSEALAVASELAERRIPVIVWPAPLGAQRADELAESELGLAASLAEKGVSVILGSGGAWPPQSRDLPLLAQLAIGHGLDRQAALEALTVRPARALDVADRLGTLERGKEADLLVLDGEPLHSTTRVQYAISAGEAVITPENP
ncbi:MAG TPA: amidohydrolase family protein [Planctomycetota bacterium]|nr:amidohydrolase family protein [Planctomycetota bacterium]